MLLRRWKFVVKKSEGKVKCDTKKKLLQFLQSQKRKKPKWGIISKGFQILRTKRIIKRTPDVTENKYEKRKEQS